MEGLVIKSCEAPKGFSDLITHQPNSYPRELFNISLHYMYLHLRLKKINCSKRLKLSRFYVNNILSDRR